MAQSISKQRKNFPIVNLRANKLHSGCNNRINFLPSLSFRCSCTNLFFRSKFIKMRRQKVLKEKCFQWLEYSENGKEKVRIRNSLPIHWNVPNGCVWPSFYAPASTSNDIYIKIRIFYFLLIHDTKSVSLSTQFLKYFHWCQCNFSCIN